jgi:hypothetical protein
MAPPSHDAPNPAFGPPKQDDPISGAEGANLDGHPPPEAIAVPWPTKPNLEVRVTLRLDRIAEAPMTLVINFIIYAAIVLVPLGLAFLFIRLGRRFSS